MTRSYNPRYALLHNWFRLFPGRSPLLGESLLFSSPGGTKMFQFPPFASQNRFEIITLQVIGLSHSEIPGSTDICSYPRLIAACHVLHRLREPRHPPYALAYFRQLLKSKNSKIEKLKNSTLQFFNSSIIISSYFQLLIRKSIYSLACVNMSKISSPKGECGEYRGRTDDLLHAMQAL